MVCVRCVSCVSCVNAQAALAYQEMAFNTEGLDLEQRIDYLSKAKIAAQSAAGRGELLSRVKVRGLLAYTLPMGGSLLLLSRACFSPPQQQQ